ncbi:4-alpha-glucanotransferase [Streptococcus dentiloxodontae]
MKRSSGILLHVTSLPSQHGIGSFGQAAYDFVDFLVASKQSYWQILPLTTTSYGDSPYQSFSAFAGNTHLIDLDFLVADGYLESSDIDDSQLMTNSDWVDYEKIFYGRRPILEKAVANFLNQNREAEAFSAFKHKQSYWLEDFADFMTIKEGFDNKGLSDWPDEKLRRHHADSVAQAISQKEATLNYHKVTQYFFFKQWQALKTYANGKGLAIIGDMPIYVSADSVELWTQPQLFKLDKDGQVAYVAGVPADDFSADGQLWGNPIYNWDYHKRTGYAWWIQRIQASLELYDMLRIDHFKGFADFWQINSGAKTAVEGSWQPGPGIEIFKVIKEKLGALPIIAEDLGDIDDKARQLLADTGYPGMKVLEFAFDNPRYPSPYLPHNAIQNSVAYIGTHDNQVVSEWYASKTNEQRNFIDRYINRREGESIQDALIRTLFAMTSDVAIITMQDILELPANTRMNTPSTIGNNWKWRLSAASLTPDLTAFLADLTELYQRAL